MDILCEIDSIYWDYMVTEGSHKVLYVHISQAICGMLVSAIIFYCKLTKELLSYSFELNPYDPCVANKMVKSEQITVRWHMKDIKSSHIDPKVNNECYNGLKTCLDNSDKSR